MTDPASLDGIQGLWKQQVGAARIAWAKLTDAESRRLDGRAEQLAGLGVGSPQVRALGEKLLSAGPDKLMPAERLLVMADERTMVWLYHEAWLRQSLAPWWKASIREFSRQDES